MEPHCQFYPPDEPQPSQATNQVANTAQRVALVAWVIHGEADLDANGCGLKGNLAFTTELPLGGLTQNREQSKVKSDQLITVLW